VSGHESESPVVAALAAAKLRALRTTLLTLHKAVLDAERQRYERAHGRIESAHEALRLAMHDPWFAWLRPLANLIVAADERLADEAPVSPADVERVSEHVRGLLQLNLAGDTFRTEYQRTLQETPDVVVAHGKVLALL
jgi:hypothetical protein